MTLALAIMATDGIVVAADSRGTVGDPRGLTAVNDTQQKLFKFGKCGFVIAGASEVALAIIDELGKRQLTEPSDIDEGLKALRQAADFCDDWYKGIPPANWPGVLFILAGYRSPNGDEAPVPLVYLLNSNTRFAPQLANKYPMMAGVPQYAVYLSHRYYDPSISSENAAALAEYLINETASQDPKVGGPVHIALVTPDGFSKYSEEDVKSLTDRNEELNTRLKTFFAEKGGKK
jgi:hypothetical protein